MATSEHRTTLGAMFRSILREGGPGAFYAGVGSPLAGQMLFRSVLFVAQHNAKEFAGPDGTLRLTGVAQSACAGMVAGGCAAFVEGPVDMFKTQRQVRRTQENVFALGARLVRQHGWSVAYQGFGATLVRNLLANAIFFTTFDTVRGPRTDFPTTFFAGSAAGLAYWTSTYWADVVKSAIQAQDPANIRYRGWWHCASSLYREGGLARFTRGFTPCIMRSMPANAAMFSTVNFAKQSLKRRLDPSTAKPQ